MQPEARRKSILQAARWCFLSFGFAKTSLGDIADRAALSRPLLYRQFKNKEAIFAAAFEEWLEAGLPKAESVAKSNTPPQEKLMQMLEVLLLGPWAEMQQAPMGAEFYSTCATLMPEVEARYAARIAKLVRRVIAGKEIAEVFLLALDGLQGGVPPVEVLRRRVRVLVQQFV